MSVDISQVEDQPWDEFCNSLLVPTKAEAQDAAYKAQRVALSQPPFTPFVPNAETPDYDETAIIEALTLASQRRPITDYKGLDWGATVVFKKLWRIANLKALIAAAKQEIKDVEADKQQFLNIYGAEMEAVQRAEQPRGKKSVLTSSGVVSLRYKPDGIDIVDPEKCQKWCKENAPQVINTDFEIVLKGLNPDFHEGLARLCVEHHVAFSANSEVSKAALNRLFKDQGVLPEGCHYRVGVEEFTFKPHNSQIEVTDAH